MILDDGGDATLVHLGQGGEKSVIIGRPTNEEEEVLFAAIKKRNQEKPGWYAALGKTSRVSLKKQRPASALRDAQKAAAVAGDQRQRQRPKSKFDNLYGCRESLVDGIPWHRCGWQGRMVVRRCRQGFGGEPKAGGLPRDGEEIDPIWRCSGDGGLRSYDGGRRHARRYFLHRDRQFGRHHCRSHAQNRAIVCNIGHFDSEISAALKNFKWHNVKPQVDEIEFSDSKRIILLSEGRLRISQAWGQFRDVVVIYQPDAGADRALG